MTSATESKAGALAGIVAVVLFLAGFFVQAPAPDPSDSGAQLAEHLADKRSLVLIGDLLIAVAGAPLVWFLAGLRAYLAAAGETVLSAAALVAGAAGGAIVVAFARSAAVGDAFPPWTYPAGLAIGLIQLATLPGLATDDGPLAAGGPVAILAFLVLSGWFAGASIILARNRFADDRG